MIPLNSLNLRHISVPFLIVGLIGCTTLANLGKALPFGDAPTPIQEISQQEQNSTLYIRGQVKEQAPFLGSGAYQLQDRTGTVWVLTNESLPRVGEQITIKGQIEYQSIPVGNQELGEFYVLELEKVAQENSISQPRQPEQESEKLNTEELLLPHKQQEK